MKAKVYFLFCLLYLIVSIILILGFHNNDTFSGNEMQQVKFISIAFYIFYSLRIFVYLSPILFYKPFKNIILLIPIILSLLMLVRIITTKYIGLTNIHLRNLEILLEVLFLILYLIIYAFVKGYFIEKRNPK